MLQPDIEQNCGKYQVTIDETGRKKLKEEENESMEQLYEEETKYEKEGEDEEDLTETKELVQQVT